MICGRPLAQTLFTDMIRGLIVKSESLGLQFVTLFEVDPRDMILTDDTGGLHVL